MSDGSKFEKLRSFLSSSFILVEALPGREGEGLAGEMTSQCY